MQLKLSRALLVYVLQICSLLAFTYGLRKFGGTEYFFTLTPSLFLFWFLYTGLVTFLTLRLAIFHPHSFSFGQLGWSSSYFLRDFILGVFGFIICFLVTGTVLKIFDAGDFSDLISGFLNQTTSQRLAYLLVGLHAAFIEESVFRGYLQFYAVDRLKKIWGVLLVALLFSLYHLQFHPIPLGIKFVFGLIFGALYLRSGSLIAPATAHLLIWLVLGES